MWQIVAGQCASCVAAILGSPRGSFEASKWQRASHQGADHSCSYRDLTQPASSRPEVLKPTLGEELFLDIRDLHRSEAKIPSAEACNATPVRRGQQATSCTILVLHARGRACRP